MSKLQENVRISYRVGTRIAWKLVDYIRYDFREIVWPSCLPDPPGYKPEVKKKLSWTEWQQLIHKTNQAYLDSWRSKPKEPEPQEKTGEGRDTTLSEEFAMTGKAIASKGVVGMKPFLTEFYKSRATAYRDAIRIFIASYREGLDSITNPEVTPINSMNPSSDTTSENGIRGEDTVSSGKEHMVSSSIPNVIDTSRIR